MSHLGNLLLGTGNGAVFAALAIALVVTYRSSGVINFATGSIALYAAYVYSYLRDGQFLPLLPGLDKTYKLPFMPNVYTGFAISLTLSALLGLTLYLAVFRPLRAAPPVAKVVASLGVQILLVTLTVNKAGASGAKSKKIYPTSKFKLGAAVVSTDRLWFALTVIILAAVLGVGFKYTRFGLATRAAAETEKGAAVSRISPQRVAAINWMLSSVVAGLAGILIASMSSITPPPLAYTFYIIPALAAAVLGRFEHLGLAAAGGLAIGMLGSETLFLPQTFSWFPKVGGPELVPLVIVLLVLVVRGKPLPERGALLQRSLGRAPRPRNVPATAAISVALGILALLALHGEWRQAYIISLIFGTLSLSLVVVSGYAGQISLAQLTLAGTAAYSLSYIAKEWGIPFPVAPILAALFATALGVVVGLPALRVRGLSVAVVTLSLAVAIENVWFKNTDIVGLKGGVDIPKPKLFGINLDYGQSKNASHIAFGLFALTVLTLAGTGVAFLRRSHLGSAMVAVRANERSAAAAGVDVFRVKLVAFAIASFIAGIGGTVLAYRYGTASDSQYLPLVGLGLFSTTYLAGITSVSGGVAAGFLGGSAVVYYATNKWFSLGKWYQIVTAVLLIVTVITNPEGITGPAHLMVRDVREKTRKRLRGSGGDMASDITTSSVSQRQTIDLTDAPTLLRVENLRVAYGGVVAVNDVSFDVPQGAIVGLIGPNGAGKTTTIDALTGFANSTGRISLNGVDLEGKRPHQRVKLGLTRTFQAIELYEDLTVEENLTVGLASGRQGFGAVSKASLDRTIGTLRIGDLRDRPAGDLSQGQRQLVSIGRALVAEPDLLLLDEPAAGLDSMESEWLSERLRDIRDMGATILMVDHDVNLVLGLCDYIVVLDFGQLIAQGTPAEIRSNRRVIDAYLGTTHGESHGESMIEEVMQ